MSWKKEWQTRTDGMKLALKIAEEKGIEGLKEEIRFRDSTKLSLTMTKAELNEATKEIKRKCIENVYAIVFMTIRDEFGFGKERLTRLYERLNSRAASMIEDMIEIEEYRQQLEKETGLTIDFSDWN